MAVVKKKLQPSRLSKDSQLEALRNEDVDLEDLRLAFKGAASRPIDESILSGSINRTIDGASTVSITVSDADKSILRSGRLTDGVDINIDGLWFRLVHVNKNGPELELVFEDREVAILRKYNKYIVRRWGKTTRARFIRDMVREVKEVDIKFVCPELAKQKTIKDNSAPKPGASPSGGGGSQASKDDNRAMGFEDNENVTVKGARASKTQRDNIERVLHVGVDMGARRKVLVATIMCIIQESSALTSATNGVHVGLFQQNPLYWPATRVPETDARAFYKKAIAYDKDHPNVDFATLIDAVQHSGNPGKNTTGKKDPFEFNLQNMFTTQGQEEEDFQFERGTKTKRGNRRVWDPENSWACIQRLAEEVHWRAFMVSGSLYFMSEPRLFQSRPRLSISESSPGVDWIDCDYDVGKRNASVTVTCRIDRWKAPPGSTIIIRDMGPMNGRWLVSSIRRDIFSADATITLKKPRARLPEPTPEDKQEGDLSDLTWGGDPGLTGKYGSGPANSLRESIVKQARLALSLKSRYTYKQVRPMASNLFSPDAWFKTDCSAFFILCYKAAGAKDPSGSNYDRSGNTTELAANGTWTNNPKPGDACMYGSSRSSTSHVALYIGNGRAIGFGSTPIKEHDVHYRSDFLGYLTFIYGDRPTNRGG